MPLPFQTDDSLRGRGARAKGWVTFAAGLAALAWTIVGSAAFTDIEDRLGHSVGGIDTPQTRERPRLELGTCYFQAGLWLQARLALAGLHSIDAKLLDAVALQELGRDQAALEVLSGLDAASSDDPRVALFQARSYAHLGMRDSAQSAIARARDRDIGNQFGPALAQIQNLVETTNMGGYAQGAGDYPYATLALAGNEAVASGSRRLRLEGGCNVARTPLGEVVVRGSVATMQPLGDPNAEGIVTNLGAHRFFGFSLGPIGARGDAMVQYTNLNLGRTGFGDVYSLESGFAASAGRYLEWGLRYRGNYGESHLTAPEGNLPGSWLHQFYALTNWHAPTTHGTFTVGASAGYLADRVGNSNQNGGWLVTLSAQYPLSARLTLAAGSGYNNREARTYVTRELMLIDRPENTWSSNIGVSYAASARTSMRLEWVGWTPVSDLKTLGYDNSNLTFSVTASY